MTTNFIPPQKCGNCNKPNHCQASVDCWCNSHPSVLQHMKDENSGFILMLQTPTPSTPCLCEDCLVELLKKEEDNVNN